MRGKWWVVNMIISGIFLCSVVILAGMNEWTYMNMPLIQVPATIGLFWFFGSWMMVLSDAFDLRG